MIQTVRLFWDKYHLVIGAVLAAIVGSLYETGVLSAQWSQILAAIIAALTGGALLTARATADPTGTETIKPPINANTAVKVVAWLTAGLAIFGLTGCSGYESSPWGGTQKANPGFRIQASPATGSIDVGCTSDVSVSAKKFNIERTGFSVNAEDFNVQSAASPVRTVDVQQLAATGQIQAIHWMGINGLVSNILSVLPGIMGRSDVPQETKLQLSQVAGSLSQYLATLGAPPSVTQALSLISSLTTKPTPTTQPAANQASSDEVLKLLQDMKARLDKLEAKPAATPTSRAAIDDIGPHGYTASDTATVKIIDEPPATQANE